MSSIVTFNFVTSSVRIVMIDGNPWFVGKDVCEALSIANHNDALGRLDDDERRGVAITDPLGIEQTAVAINESGLYSLILTSRKPEAKKFKKWVTSEVLPAIRKTGRYEVEPPRPGIPDQQWREILNLIHAISHNCHYKGGANDAVHERIRWMGGVPGSRLLAPELFEDAKRELTALAELAEQHFNRWVTIDREFIEQVLRPPVSVRKVRALVRRQIAQPSLSL
jgi:hypothetical protein